ncbi:MAG: alcohol dehydrogenase catalytic domain-containing protein [Anaerolineales bacterium]|nr:alcohol dehydrogenase catalytic domain-containing protein [Anaerolineales bacterium]
MTNSTIRGYVAKALGLPLEPFTYEPPELGQNDVRVSVTHCGLCHTDIQAIDNYYGITTFPFVPGHEIVGHVSAKGSGVFGLEEGDRVGIGWQGRSCGECEWCQKGETQLCMEIEDTTVMVPYGGFSSSVVADYRFVYPVPPSMPSEFAAVLMCAGLTVYSALYKHVTIPGLKVAVVGIGGLGHLAIQFTNAFGCEVMAISSSPTKKDQALGFGARQFLDSTDSANLRKFNYSFDLLICTANAGISWEALLMTLKKRGKLILLGFPDVAFNSTDLVAHELSIVGSLIGNPNMMRAMLSFAQNHNIAPMVELMPMSQVNNAIQKLKENQARYRIVMFNESEGMGAQTV